MGSTFIANAGPVGDGILKSAQVTGESVVNDTLTQPAQNESFWDWFLSIFNL
ncbi:hypothetical protein [Xanthovirga aplysinae]|uniref:hypothetical protein n=1 Tax=Xanthovirga aplysinae TaxID=2529853 RepID=UPI0016570024|nr:hypothetical protein [Xanthovirga aplysinae]